jgi:transcription antitermination factor NusG
MTVSGHAWCKAMNLNGFNSEWVAIQVRPRYELGTSDLLRYKGYEIFVPTFRSQRQWSDRTKEVEMPLFTGYLFCKFNVEIRNLIMITPGVIRIVGSRNEAATIDEREIEALRRVTESRVPARPCSFMNVGDRVRIQDGSLAGVEGILVRHKSRDRLVLSVNLVQRSVEVEVDGAKLEVLNN